MVTENVDIRFREQGTRVIKRRIDDIGRASNNAARQINIAQRALFVLGGAGVIRGLVRQLDLLTNYENRLRLTARGAANLETVQSRLFDVANRSRTGFEAVAEIYSRTALSVRELGISQQETARFTESLAKASILSGASAREANAALIQLGQGLASNRLSGDELRSVLEQLPFVADVIAKSLGITRGELRQFGRQGKITAEAVLTAFRGSADEIDKAFAQTESTIGQALSVGGNNLLEFIDRFDDATGASAALAKTIIFLSENIDTLAIVLAGAAAGFVAFRFATFVQGLLSAAQASLALNAAVKAGDAVILGSVQAENLKAQSLLRTAQAQATKTATQTAAIRQGIVQLTQNAALLASEKTQAAITVANGRARSVATGQFVALAAAKANLNRITSAQILTDRALRASQVELTAATAAQAVATNGLAAATARATAASLAMGGTVARLSAAMPLLGTAIGFVTLGFRALTAAIIANPLGALIFVLTSVAIGFGLVSAAMADTSQATQDVTVSVDEYLNSLDEMRKTQADTTRELRQNVVSELETVARQISSLQEFINNPGGPGRAGMFGENIRAAERALTPLLERYNLLEKQLSDLTRVLEAQEEVQERVISNAETAALTQINRTIALAEATETSVQAVKALNDQYENTDAIAQFRQRLEKANVEASIADDLVDRFAASLTRMNQAARNNAVGEAAEQIRRMQLELSAIDQGTAVFEEFQRTIGQIDAIRNFRESLQRAGVDTAIIEQLTRQFTESLIRLNDATAQLKVDDEIASITAEIERMNAEALAISQGQAALRRFQEQAAQTQQIEQFRQRLEDAGVTGSQLTGIIQQLTSAIFGLAAAAGQARIDSALEDAADATARVRAETEALAGGKDAFSAFRNSRTVTDSVNSLRTSLERAGVEESVITQRVNDHRAAMERLVTQRDRYNNSLRSGRTASRAAASETKRFNDIVFQLERDIEIARQTNGERRITNSLLEIEKKLKRELTETEAQLVRTKLEALDIAQKEAEILESIKGPREASALGLMALNNLYERGVIGLTEYIDKLRELQIESNRASNTISGGFKAAIGDAILTANELGEALGGVVVSSIDSMVDSLFEGKFSFKDFARSVIADIAKIIIKQQILRALGFVLGIPSGGGLGGGGGLPGLSLNTGGSILPSGPGNTDTQVISFNKRPDERVDVLTPAQQRNQQKALNEGRNGRSDDAPSSMPPIIFNVNTPNAESFRKSESQIAGQLNRMVQRGFRSS